MVLYIPGGQPDFWTINSMFSLRVGHKGPNLTFFSWFWCLSSPKPWKVWKKYSILSIFMDPWVENKAAFWRKWNLSDNKPYSKNIQNNRSILSFWNMFKLSCFTISQDIDCLFRATKGFLFGIFNFHCSIGGVDIIYLWVMCSDKVLPRKNRVDKPKI